MNSLSDDLVVLAQGLSLDDAATRRTSAQILALSLALNPANPTARSALGKLTAGQSLQKIPKRELDRSQARVWHSLTWLQMPEAGPDGQALGFCLGDVIANADPTHPSATALLKAGEKGAWKGWIPEITSYEDAQIAKVDPVMEKTKVEPEMPLVSPVTKIALENASLRTPLWIADATTGTDSMQLVELKMRASIVPPVEGGVPVRPMNFTIDHTLESGIVNRMTRDVLQALNKQLGQLPPGSQAAFNLGEETPYQARKDQDAISGAAAVLLSAAVSGNEPTGIVLGRIDADGGFRVQADFWDRLRFLSKGPGGRLVIPTEAADMLPSILALEEPEFFLKYDVLLASNLTELIERSAKVPASPLPEILTRFQDVRAKGTGLPVGQYVVNRFVRQRLIDLSNEAPFYASPRLLAIQAAGERPTRLPRKILARELKRAIRPIDWIRGKTAVEINLTQLDLSYDTARAEVDKLERYADTSDRNFLVGVREMTTTLRTFSRASRVGVNRENGAATVASALEAMRSSYLKMVAELNAAAGEIEPVEVPPQ